MRPHRPHPRQHCVWGVAGDPSVQSVGEASRKLDFATGGSVWSAVWPTKGDEMRVKRWWSRLPFVLTSVNEGSCQNQPKPLPKLWQGYQNRQNRENHRENYSLLGTIYFYYGFGGFGGFGVPAHSFGHGFGRGLQFWKARGILYASRALGSLGESLFEALWEVGAPILLCLCSSGHPKPTTRLEN